MAAVLKRIPLDRRVCVVREGRIDIRPERAALVGPLLGLLISGGLFAGVALLGSELSATALAAMLLPGLVLGPLSAMGFVYSLVGAHVVVDGRKQSAAFQQGVLGLGLGTVELAPFWKINRVEVRDCPLGEVALRGPAPPLDLRAWEIVMVKESGKELLIGQVVAANAPDLIDEGFDRALDAAEAIAALAGKPVVITAAVEEPAALPQPGPAEPGPQPDADRAGEKQGQRA